MDGTQSRPLCINNLNLSSFSSNIFSNNYKSSFKIRAWVPTPRTQIRNPTKHRQRIPKYRSRKRKSSSFKEKDAFPASLPLHAKNPAAIYKDIQSFANRNKLKEALTIMDYLDQQGIPVNVTTFSSLIAACIRFKCLDQAKKIHVYIRINGLENNEFLRTKLVHLYTSCGSFKDAHQVFDESSINRSSNVYPWNALLRGTVISGSKRYLDVLSAYTTMRELGVELNVYSFSNVIKSFAGASALRQGLKTHALLVKNGLIDSSILRTSLIDMYFKCGKIKLAHKVFAETVDRDIVVWGTMISGFAHNRRQWEALQYLRWMISEGVYPNSVILTIVLPVIGEVWARKLGKEIHGYIVKTKSYSKQLTIQSGLIDMYCKCRDMGSGRRVFYSSRERNTISWTALMSGYVSNGRPEQALRSVAWMQQEGFRPDVVTVATVVPVCAELKALNHGKELHAYAVKNLFFPNVSVTTSLMKMYSKCGVLDYSLKLFDTMISRNVISWTAIIDSYVENRCIYEAMDVFRSMQFSKHRPDSVLISRMLSICREIKAIKLGKEIHGHAIKRDFESIPFVSAELVMMYGSCGLIDNAKSMFHAIPVKGSMAWTAIIQAYGYKNLWREAIHLFNEMISRGFAPTHFTFEVVLSICDQAGFAEDANRIFKLMCRRYKIKPSGEHYRLLARLLTGAGCIQEAERYIQMSHSSS